MMVERGQPTTMSVIAEGVGTLNYSWRHNGLPLPGADGPTLELTAVDFAHRGYYQPVIQDTSGERVGSAIFLVVSSQTQVVVKGPEMTQTALDSLEAVQNAIDAVVGQYSTWLVDSTGRIRNWSQSTGLSASSLALGAVQVASTSQELIVLKDDGTLTAVRQGALAPAFVPTLQNVVAISASFSRGYALLGDGTVVNWPAGRTNPVEVLSGVSDAIAVNCGLVLRRSGEVMAFNTYASLANVPDGLVAKAVDGNWHERYGIAARTDGSVAVWGDSISALIPPVGLTNVQHISAGYSHAFALKEDGTAETWGSYRYDIPATWSGAVREIFAVRSGENMALALRDTVSDTAPSVTNSPADQTVNETLAAVFNAGFAGDPIPNLRWQQREAGLTAWRDLEENEVYSGVRSGQLTVSDVTTAMDASHFRCVARNTKGTVATTPAALDVTSVPVIRSQSARREVFNAGEPMLLFVQATGTGTLSYQWFRNGRPIPTANAAEYRIANPTLRDNGMYRVTVTDEIGSRKSDPIFAAVVQPNAISAWGSYSQSSIRSDLKDVVDLAVGDSAAIALRADGTVAELVSSSRNILAGIKNIVALSVAESGLIYALTADGRVTSWNEFNGGSHLQPNLENAIAIDGGRDFLVALLENGKVWVSNPSSIYEPPADLGEVAEISSGDGQICATLANGSVRAWGINNFGLTDVPPGLANVQRSRAGSLHNLVLKADGTVVAWGDNSRFQCAVPSDLSGVVDLSAGGLHSLALKSDGSIAAWGNNDYNCTVVPATATPALLVQAGIRSSFSLTPRTVTGTAPQITLQPENRAIQEGQTAQFTASASGTPAVRYQWQRRRTGETHWETVNDGTTFSGATTDTLKLLAAPWTINGDSFRLMASNGAGPSAFSEAALLVVDSLPKITISGPQRLQKEKGESLELAATVTGTGALTFEWFHDGRTIEGATGPFLLRNNLGTDDSGTYRVAVTDDRGTKLGPAVFVQVNFTSRVYAWGDPFLGATALPSGLTDVVAIAAGDRHGLALHRDGRLTSWGNITLDLPTGHDHAVGVATGNDLTLVLWDDGSVKFSPTSIPYVPPEQNVVQVASGASFNATLCEDGTVVSWGFLPGSPPGLNDVIRIAAGDRHILALRRDHTVVAWGETTWGQCNVPTDLTDVVAIAAGERQSVALKRDGSVVAWGGDQPAGTVSALSAITAIEAGAGTGGIVAVRSDGTIVQWPLDSANLPPAVIVGTHQLSALGPFTVALCDEAEFTPPVVTRQPTDQVAVELQGVEFSIEATGHPPPQTYRWQFRPSDGEWSDAQDGALFSGGQTSILSLQKVPLTLNGTLFRCIVGNTTVDTISDTAQLQVRPVPKITALSAPRQVLKLGDSLQLSVQAQSDSSIHYQWRHNGTDIPGATTDTLDLGALEWNERGWYQVLLTNDVGVRPSPVIFVEASPTKVRLAAWGANPWGQTNLPAGLDDVLAIASGSDHCLALKQDGTVIGWGDNRAGQATSPSGLANVVQVAAGGQFSLALRSDGTVVGWGSNQYQQIAIPVGLTDVVSIACGTSHSLALKSDGTVVAWGHNDAYQCKVPTGLSNAVGVAGDSYSSFAWRADGSATAWGASSFVPSLADGYRSIAAGDANRVALGRAGAVIAWGGNYPEENTVPTDLAPVRQVAAGSGFNVALQDDGRVRVWGSNYKKEAVVPSEADDTITVTCGTSHVLVLCDASHDTESLVQEQPTDTSAAVGESAHFFVTTAGHPTPRYQWQGRRGTSDWSNLNANGSVYGVQMAHLVVSNVDAAMAGDRYRCVVTNSTGSQVSEEAVLTINSQPTQTNFSRRNVVKIGDVFTLHGPASTDPDGVYVWRKNGVTLANVTSSSLTLPAVTLEDGGIYECVAIDQAGRRTSGLMRIFPKPPFTTALFNVRGPPLGGLPFPGSSLDNAWAINGTLMTYLALLADGTVKGWGSNLYQNAEPPAGLDQVVAIAASSSHSLALRQDGTVVAWGLNTSGQCNVPATLHDVVAIAAGGLHCLALRSDGTVMAWGDNSQGQAPTAVDWVDVVGITAGSTRNFGVRIDGSLALWGSASNSDPGAYVPANLGPVIGIDASLHNVAFLRDGQVVVWGDDFLRNYPPPANLHDVIAVDAGDKCSFALQRDQNVVSWGFQNSGLGIPNIENRALTMASGYHSYALLLEIRPPQIQNISGSTQVLAATWISLYANVTGDGPFQYQWKKNDEDIPGATDSVLYFFAQPSDSGRYSVVVSNRADSVESDYHLLSVYDSFQNYCWQTFSELELDNVAISGARADPDGDGRSNLLEYAFGLNAKSQDSTPPVQVLIADGHLLLSYLRRKDVGDLTYTVEVSSDLVTWQSGIGITETSGIAQFDAFREKVTAKDIQGGGRRYIRLKVTGP